MHPADSGLPPCILDRTADPDILQAAQSLGLHPLAAQVLAYRASAVNVDPAWLLDSSLRSLDPPHTLPDIERAAERIALAIRRREIIALATDADSDGVNAHTVLQRALTEHFHHPPEHLQSYIGLKLTEGYGLSAGVIQRILAAQPRPHLLITADIGSSDAPRIATLVRAGIAVIVTDHHGIPVQGGPEAAHAFVNPLRNGHVYPDPLIAGVMVAWLVMAAVRPRLIACGHLPSTAPTLANLLGWVATGTVADVVSLARSRNNRIVVRAGLRQIDAGTHPCWRALRPFLGDPAKPLRAADLAYAIGPRLNAAGRLHDAMAGVHFLLAATDQEAEQRVEILNATNLERRAIEKRLTEHAMAQAHRQVQEGRHALVIFLEEGHAGVQGIVASRLMQAFARPALCLSRVAGPQDEDCWTGSGRSIDGFHLLENLQEIEQRNPGLFQRYGGHAAAAGLTLAIGAEHQLHSALEDCVQQRLGSLELRPRLWVDGDVAPGMLDLTLVQELEALAPFGREFPEPILRGHFVVRTLRALAGGVHWRLRLDHGGRTLDAVWFQAGTPCPVQKGQSAWLLFTPEANWWQGQPRLQLRIHAQQQRPLPGGETPIV
jgi:single-stranded-DNA-specific exonuclease